MNSGSASERIQLITEHGQCSCWDCTAARIYQRVWNGASTAERLILDQVWDRMEENAQSIPTPQSIERSVCKQFQVSMRKLRGRKRTLRLTAIRRVLARRLRDELGMSTIEIGERMGGRAHATIANLLTDRGERKVSGPGSHAKKEAVDARRMAG